jgi:hypothetical protein
MNMQLINSIGCGILLLLLGGMVSAQSEAEGESSSKDRRLFSMFVLADQMGTTLMEASPEGAIWGVGVQWRKQSTKGLLASGFDLAYQPVGSIESEVAILENNAITNGTLKARNQYLTAHYALRLSPFQGWFQPFAEGFAGGRAAVLNTEFSSEDATIQEKLADTRVENFGATWNYGWGFGFRLRLAEGFYVQARYADITSGDLDQVVELSIAEDGAISTTIEPTPMPTSSIMAGISWDMGLKKAKRAAAGQ